AQRCATARPAPSKRPASSHSRALSAPHHCRRTRAGQECRLFNRSSAARSPVWAKLGRTQLGHFSSGLPPKADSDASIADVAEGPKRRHRTRYGAALLFSLMPGWVSALILKPPVGPAPMARGRSEAQSTRVPTRTNPTIATGPATRRERYGE